MGINPDIAHSSPNYRVSLTNDLPILKIEKQKIQIKFTQDQRILKGVYNVPQIVPSQPTKKRLPNRSNMASRSTGNSGNTGNSVVDYVRKVNKAKFGDQHWNALYNLIKRESGWNMYARNSSSGACGLFQALPCSKMGGMSLSNQTSWGLNYIASRYGTPTRAYNYQISHNWY